MRRGSDSIARQRETQSDGDVRNENWYVRVAHDFKKLASATKGHSYEGWDAPMRIRSFITDR
jgi:hypothetical protein